MTQVSSWAKDGVCKTPGNECVMGSQGLKRSIVVPNMFGGKACPSLIKTTPCVLEECLSMFRKQAAMLETNATNATSSDAKTLEFAYKATKQLLDIATKTAATGSIRAALAEYNARCVQVILNGLLACTRNSRLLKLSQLM